MERKAQYRVDGRPTKPWPERLWRPRRYQEKAGYFGGRANRSECAENSSSGPSAIQPVSVRR